MRKGIHLLPEEENQKRLALYNEGLNDREIGERCYVAQSVIATWRKNNGLKAHVYAENRFNGEKLKKLRMEKGFTQVDLAVEIEMAPTIITYYEHGFGKPKKKTVSKIANALGVPTDVLCD